MVGWKPLKLLCNFNTMFFPLRLHWCFICRFFLFFSFSPQTTQPPYWPSGEASAEVSNLCIDCPCWLWTAGIPPSAAPTRSRCACATATPTAWRCLAAPWRTPPPASAPGHSWPSWAVSSRCWVRTVCVCVCVYRVTQQCLEAPSALKDTQI